MAEPQSISPYPKTVIKETDTSYMKMDVLGKGTLAPFIVAVTKAKTLLSKDSS